MVSKDSQILVVGTGAFGISTALHLLRRGYTNVTVIDQASTLPAPDAASTDINKVVRTSYSEIAYTKLAQAAIEEWKKEEWGDTYQESGVLLRGGSYSNLALANDKSCGVHIQEFQNGEELRSIYPPNIELGPLLLHKFEGYLNKDSGWAKARQAVELAIEQVRRLGGRVEGNKQVVGILPDGQGVKLSDGTEVKAELVVIATGSWTPSTFGSLGLSDRVSATGQCIATIQLAPEEAEIYKDVPIVLDYTNGFCMFPPNPENIVKVGFYAGFTNLQDQVEGRSVSIPRTFLTHDNGGAIPKHIVQEMRGSIADTYPELGKKPFSGTRLCWYADTPDSDWLIDFHPDYPSVLFATGGSGHAYKFMPILGRLVVDRIENTLDPILTQKFAFDRIFTSSDLSDFSRALPAPTQLDLGELCTPEDLLP
ncbi:hypothetical protein M422DRAFT_37755 [Sphaerobolus stellatus SS14]|uniref:FAD dependent oxidoreductase domain-containing protein n=1 Tax=Sphaerobolus stellatus (strain SS14) TaxID=990650 RepID=A0A0C9UQ33_SPHS4|nr:hypothetical protein M422DRAFT_37755 [Sphaerobolus stellatus SS14]